MKVELSGHKFEFPRQCACCGCAADTTLAASASRSSGKKVVHTESKIWDFPYCSGCVRHVRAAKQAKIMAILIVVAGVVLATLASSSAPSGLSGFLVLAGGIAGYIAFLSRAKQMCSQQCAGVRVAVGYSGWHGTLHRFDIASEQYALQFMIANRQKLVNVPQQMWERLNANGPTPTANQSQSARRHMS